jgi:hypothetical protein
MSGFMMMSMNNQRIVPATAAVVYVAGLFRTTYAGYFDDNVNFFASGGTSTSVQTTNIFEQYNGEDGDGNPSDEFDNFSMQWLGYFKPTTTETYTFWLNSDDASYMWIGSTAVTGFGIGNELINNGGPHGANEVSGSIALNAGQYYPVRIQFGELGGNDFLEFNYGTPTIAKTTNVTGKVFYNPATNGF